MIHLTKDHYIASGNFCECYIHPERPRECIKIIKGDSHKAKKRLRADLNYYKKLHKKGVSLEYIADFLGVTETSRGRGYRYECIRDENSEVSQPLKLYLERGDRDKAVIYDQLAKLVLYLLENRIMIGDLHANNILMQESATGLKPVIVDGIGDRVAIKLLNLFPRLVEAKIRRRWNRFSAKFLDSQVTI